jgi:hypothetical protein
MTHVKDDGDRQAHAAGTTAGEPITTIGNLDGWTSDELFAEALRRRAGDFPALRAMQELTLRAQLTAGDGK